MSNKINPNTDYSYLFNSSSNSGSNSTSDLFSNLSTSNNSYSLSDYASIKNGSYGKLLKTYYAKQKASSTDTKQEKDEKTANNNQIRTDVNSLKNASDVLTATGSDSIFNKVTKTDKDGKTTTDYDTDRIYENVKNFVDSYNSLIKSGGDSDNKAILRNTLGMVKQTSVNANLLKKIGITIGEDNKLSVDKDTLKKADINTMKSLFSGHASYADAIHSYAGRIENYSTRAAQKNGTYTASGSYATSASTGKTGSILDDYL